MAAPYIPPRDEDLDSWSANFSTLLTAAPATYGVTAADATAVAGVVGIWHTKFAIAINPLTRTKPTVADKNSARSAMLATVRPIAQQIANNNGVTDMNKEALGLNLHGATGPTPIGPPSTAPIVAVIAGTPQELTLRFSDQNTPDSRSKPAGVKLLILFAATSPTVITDPTTLPFAAIATKQPYALDTEAGDAGKRIYIAGRWANARGEPGPWSNITSYIVV